MAEQRLAGKVALVTGAARGQGRAHAIRLAAEGAKVIVTDICEQIESVPYPLSTKDDLEQTATLVRAAGASAVAIQCDVRDRASVEAAVQRGVEACGPIDILCANAGILAIYTQGDPLRQWRDSLDVILDGTFNSAEAVLPGMVARGRGGSVILIGSQGAMTGLCGAPATATPGLLAYMAGKHGVVALMKAYANAYGPAGIRVNVVHPGSINTPMGSNPELHEWMAAQPDLATSRQSPIRVRFIEPDDVADTVAWLASDESKYVTGQEVYVDAGRHNA